MAPVVILGAGGHARVVIELIIASGGTVAALTDRDPTPREVLGVPVVGDDAALEGLYAHGLRHAFIAIGDNAARLAARAIVDTLGFSLVNAVSPRAIVSPSATLARGVAVMAGAVINAGAGIADLAIINTGAVVDHECQLGAACHIGPGAVLAGAVSIGERAQIGAGATVTPGRSIGVGAIVGAGACVVGDVAEGATVVGVPARALRR
ncbi:MAG TPA: acetyltransferase [Caulobacteraceae bacterium]|jgi:UDP-perosamine 4-acetyltransferase|nr:acetyltransferase [Caulobacteraceae bacterium]